MPGTETALAGRLNPHCSGPHRSGLGHLEALSRRALAAGFGSVSRPLLEPPGRRPYAAVSGRCDPGISRLGAFPGIVPHGWQNIATVLHTWEDIAAVPHAWQDIATLRFYRQHATSISLCVIDREVSENAAPCCARLHLCSRVFRLAGNCPLISAVTGYRDYNYTKVLVSRGKLFGVV